MDAKVCSDGGICLWYSALCGKHRMSCHWSMDMRFSYGNAARSAFLNKNPSLRFREDFAGVIFDFVRR